MLLNVYLIGVIPSSPLAKTTVPSEYGEWTQENAVVRWQKMEEPRITHSLAVTTDAMLHWTFFYEQGWHPYHSMWPFENIMERFKWVEWLYFNPENPIFRSTGKKYTDTYPRLDEETISLIQNTPMFHKVYDNKEWEIYRIKE